MKVQLLDIDACPHLETAGQRARRRTGAIGPEEVGSQLGSSSGGGEGGEDSGGRRALLAAGIEVAGADHTVTVEDEGGGHGEVLGPVGVVFLEGAMSLCLHRPSASGSAGREKRG